MWKMIKKVKEQDEKEWDRSNAERNNNQNLPNYIRNSSQVQKAEENPSSINTYRTTPGPIRLKLLKTKGGNIKSS